MKERLPFYTVVTDLADADASWFNDHSDMFLLLQISFKQKPLPVALIPKKFSSAVSRKTQVLQPLMLTNLNYSLPGVIETIERSHLIQAPLYRLRSALTFLWLGFPPPVLVKLN